ncbi:MAG: hypothetical protein P1V36_11785 [Planctomycetota bacterium]|nr:hypothetical protein [Planctomycetota bacterium]
MRFTVGLISVCALLLAAACGGGGAGGAGELITGKAVISGGVSAVDGDSTNVAGVELVLRETGERVFSDTSGRFGFESAAGGDLTVVLERAALLTAGDDDDAGDDDADDGVEGSDHSIRIRDVLPGERVELRLRIRDGRLERIDMARGDDSEDTGRELEIDMTPSAENDDPAMRGEVELEMDAEGESFEVEVEYAAPARALRVLVLDGMGGSEDLGVRVVDLEGEAEWELETEDGDRLPLGVVSVTELAGFEVQVRDADTDVLLLSVMLPEMPAGTPAGDDDSDEDDSDDDDSDDDDSDDDDSDDDGSDDDGSDDDSDSDDEGPEAGAGEDGSAAGSDGD